MSVKAHKSLKGLKTQNLPDHMSEAELIFTALAELATRQLAETVIATGMPENKKAAKSGGKIARRARLELESKTGRQVVTGENYLPPRISSVDGVTAGASAAESSTALKHSSRRRPPVRK